MHRYIKGIEEIISRGLLDWPEARATLVGVSEAEQAALIEVAMRGDVDAFTTLVMMTMERRIAILEEELISLRAEYLPDVR